MGFYSFTSNADLKYRKMIAYFYTFANEDAGKI